jgi:hypothetical protein
LKGGAQGINLNALRVPHPSGASDGCFYPSAPNGQQKTDKRPNQFRWSHGNRLARPYSP